MSGKIVVITGASSGIGAALSRQLASQGHQLVIAARRENELKQVAAQTESRAIPVVTDVTRRADLENLRDFALKKHSHIDVWVNNAGRGITKTVMELTDQEFDSIIDVVLKSVFYGTQTIVPHFQGRGRAYDQHFVLPGQSSAGFEPIRLQRGKERGQRSDGESTHGSQGKVPQDQSLTCNATHCGHRLPPRRGNNNGGEGWGPGGSSEGAIRRRGRNTNRVTHSPSSRGTLHQSRFIRICQTILCRRRSFPQAYSDTSALHRT